VADLNQMAERECSPTVRKVFGPTILLAGGTYLDLLKPEDCVFTIEDIAHGLSNVCRFAGQCDPFYSVAEHSVHVSQLVPAEHALAGLLHDAAEAFIGDVSKPLKDLLPEYRAIERHMEEVVLGRFGLTLPLAPEIKEVDVVMLATEQRVIMKNRDDWNYTRGRAPADIILHCWGPKEAKRMFLRRFVELTEQPA
jgi:hypothetical protein